MAELALGFDTSAAHCAAALVLGDRVLASACEGMARGQAEHLFPLIEALLAKASHRWDELDVIGVGTGPGNFTGIRIAVAAARGLALSLAIPAIGVGAAEALACGLPRPCRILLPMRGDDVTYQDFSAEGAGALATAPREAVPPGPPVAAAVTPIAVGIAKLALTRAKTPQPRPAPIYLRPADAAPARERGPLMLS